MKKSGIVAVILGLAVLAAACTQQQSGQENGVRTSSANVPKAGDVVDGIRVVDQPGDVVEAIDSYQGKIVLVNFWASWCPPCRAEMPDIVRISEQYKEQDVVVLGVNLDEPEDLSSDVVPYVAETNIRFPLLNYAGDTGQLVKHFSDNWRGEIPTTFVYDANGNQKQEFKGMLSYDELEEIVTNMRRQASVTR